MFTKENSIFIIIIAGECIIGMLGNGYIALMCWTDCTKKKKTSSLNYILTILAISRICLLFILIVSDMAPLLFLDYYRNIKLVLVISVFWIIINYSSLWFATCLNIFYLLKIANFSCPLFLWLKWRIDRVIYWILLGSFVISFLSSLLMLMPHYYEEIYKHIKHKINITEMFHVNEIKYFSPTTLPNLLAIVPYTVSLIAFFLLILSLWRHIKQMKLTITGWRDPSTEAHVAAMRNVTSFLFLLFIYYGGCLMVTFSYLIEEERLVSAFGKIMVVLYPSGHSLILIIGNSKLRQTSVRILRCGKGEGNCLVENISFIK
ncbi:taste receptor type 2 member 8-like [Suncus etruscus]|uniref:taste receptor type 2 member 8-like n=1 Tax=Suncus etruscus TaxID=109475 RepID=UPI002110D0CA|nr:taste receptor type 2 member 8-like [Suncus etruscus]